MQLNIHIEEPFSQCKYALITRVSMLENKYETFSSILLAYFWNENKNIRVSYWVGYSH